MKIKHAIVYGLEVLCGWVDYIPGFWKESGGWKFYRHAQYGCGKLNLARRAIQLDRRWGTEVGER